MNTLVLSEMLHDGFDVGNGLQEHRLGVLISQRLGLL